VTFTPEQFVAAGSAGRKLLEFAWASSRKNPSNVIAGIIAVAKTFKSDVPASTLLLRRMIAPDHLKRSGHEELSWLTRQILPIADSDPGFAVDIYRAAYSYEDESADKTNMGNSTLMPLTSNRRQDYHGAWFPLEQAIPKLFQIDIDSAMRAVARSIGGYIRRRESTPGDQGAKPVTFALRSAAAHFLEDSSYSWYRGGFVSRQDAPVLLTKFDEFLSELANQPDAKAKFLRLLDVAAGEAGYAVIWASFLVAGTNHPAEFASSLVPLATAASILSSFDTRYQVGQFISAAYPLLDAGDRAAIEHAILALTGKMGERHKEILAGCIPSDLIETDTMRMYLDRSDGRAPVPPNAPAVQMTFSRSTFDTDAFLASEGVRIENPASAELRELMRQVEELPTVRQVPEFTIQAARQQVDVIDALHKAVSTVSRQNVPVKLSEHAAGILGSAAARVSRAPISVIGSRTIRLRLRRTLLFCAKSKNPHFNAAHERGFQENLSWGGPSARTDAAIGLINLVRADKKSDPTAIRAIHKLAVDRVCHVRLQIIENLHMLRGQDAEWAWTTIERVTASEPTRGVVTGVLSALGGMAYLNVPRAIKICKGVIKRYQRAEKPGMAVCRTSAAALIFDVHLVHNNVDATEFASRFMEDVIGNSSAVRIFIARYSDRLRSGHGHIAKPSDADSRRKVLAFYGRVVQRAYEEITNILGRFDIHESTSWPADTLATIQAMFSILDEVALRLMFAAGGGADPASAAADVVPGQVDLYKEIRPLMERLAEAAVASVAHHLIETLETFIAIDAPGVFDLIARSVRSSEQGGYAIDQMAAALVVRIVERYLADHRSVFADPIRLQQLIDCLDVFVRAGWPSAQSLTFRLQEIWR